MLRRSLLVMMVAGAVLADVEEEVSDFVAAMAGALSEGSASGFLSLVDPQMPRYGKLAELVEALVSQNDVTCSVDIIQNDGDDNSRRIELDWLMDVRSKETSGPFRRRQATVKATLRREKKKWRAVALEPIEFFAPGGAGP